MKYILLTGFLLLACCSKKTAYYPVPVADMYRDPVLRAPKGKVMEPAQIESYPVARYRDAKDPNIMHEQHFVYKRQAPKWKLTASPYERVYLGEAAGVRSGRTVQVTAEDRVVSTRQQREIQLLQNQVGQLAEGQEAIAAYIVNRQPKQQDNSQGKDGQNTRQPDTYTPPQQ